MASQEFIVTLKNRRVSVAQFIQTHQHTICTNVLVFVGHGHTHAHTFSHADTHHAGCVGVHIYQSMLTQETCRWDDDLCSLSGRRGDD